MGSVLPKTFAGKLALATDDTTPLATLLLLAKESNAKLLKAVLFHANADESLISLIAKNPDKKLRLYAALYERTSALTLSQLITDQDPSIRAAALTNPKLPRSEAESCLKDPDGSVFMAAARALYSEFDTTLPLVVMERILQQPEEHDVSFASHALDHWCWGAGLPAEMSIRLSESKQRSVRETIAAAPTTSIQLLEKLAKDKHDRVRRYVADNEACPLSLLVRLAKDKDPKVRESVAFNKITTREILQTLSKDADKNVKATVALHPSCGPELLAELGKDRSKIVREAVAKASAKLKQS